MDQKYILAHLEESIWKNKPYGEILLIIGSKKYRVRYAGVSNINGILAIKLIPCEEKDLKEIFHSKESTEMYILMLSAI